LLNFALPDKQIGADPPEELGRRCLLQASRLGSDLDGRRYTIAVGANDNTGNAASKSIAVIVPHDQGR